MTFAEYEMENFGYEVKTTFWEDFSIADRFGEHAIIDTFKRAFKEWSDNVEYITELVLVLNLKCWNHYNGGKTTLSELYGQLYEKLNDWCYENLKGDELTYYFNVTD